MKIWHFIKEWWFVFLAIIVWLIYGWIWLPNYETFETNVDLEKTGSWGDSFGGFNALVSGLAFLILIKTLLIQREELRLQRKELKATRSVLKLQQKELEEQKRVMQKETLERTLFQFVAIIEQAYMSAKIMESTDPFVDVLVKGDSSINKNDPDLVARTKPYFSLVCTMLVFIDNTDFLDNREKIFYLTVFRDKIGEPGLLALLWMGSQPLWCIENRVMVNLKIDEFQNLIEEYKLFNVIRHSALEDLFYENDIHFSCFFKQTAFGERSDLDEFYSQSTLDDLAPGLQVKK